MQCSICIYLCSAPDKSSLSSHVCLSLIFLISSLHASRCILCFFFTLEQDRTVHRAAKSVSNIIAEFPLSIQCMILLDYVDDIFDLIAGSESTPTQMLNFVDSCMSVQHYF